MNTMIVNRLNTSITLIVLIVIFMLVMMPLILQNDVIDSIRGSSDIKAHTGMVRQYSELGNTDGSLYLGQRLFAYVTSPFVEGDLEGMYIGFCFAIIALVVVILFYVISSVAGVKVAMIAVPATIFCTPNMLALMNYGIVFSIINVYIILPLSLLAGVYWVTKRKWYYYALALAGFSLYSSFHFTGSYLMFGLVIALISYGIYCFIKKTHGLILPVLALAVPTVILNILLVWYTLDLNLVKIGDYAMVLNYDNVTAMLNVLLSHIYIVPVVLLVGVFIIWLSKRWVEVLDAKAIIFLVVVLSFVVALIGGVLLQVTTDIIYINRMATDMAILATMAVAILMGQLVKLYKNKMFTYAVYAVVIIGSVPVLILWI